MPKSANALNLLRVAVLFGLVKSAFGAGLLAVDNPAKWDKEGAFVSIQAFQASDAVPLRNAQIDWAGHYAARDGTNIAMLVARAETGYQWGAWRLGVLSRGQAIAQANRDTMDFAHALNTTSGYDLQRVYDLDYTLTGFSANGIKLATAHTMDWGGAWTARWGVAGALLKGTQLKIESVNGSMSSISAQDVSANASARSLNTAMDVNDPSQFNPLVPSQSTGGEGYAVDVGLMLQRNDGLKIELAVNDMAAEMAWRGVPQRVASISTATKYYDAAGYVHFNPSATARSDYVHLIQRLEPQLAMSVTYPVRGSELTVSATHFYGIWIPEFGISSDLATAWRLHTGYDLRFGTLMLGISHPRFDIALRTSHLDFAQAKAYGLQLSANFPL